MGQRKMGLQLVEERRKPAPKLRCNDRRRLPRRFRLCVGANVESRRAAQAADGTAATGGAPLAAAQLAVAAPAVPCVQSSPCRQGRPSPDAHDAIEAVEMARADATGATARRRAAYPPAWPSAPAAGGIGQRCAMRCRGPTAGWERSRTPMCAQVGSRSRR